MAFRAKEEEEEKKLLSMRDDARDAGHSQEKYHIDAGRKKQKYKSMKMEDPQWLAGASTYI